VVTVLPTIHLYFSILHPQLALCRCGNDADAAIELLMMHPNGLLSTVNDNDDTAVLADEDEERSIGDESQSGGKDASGVVGMTVDAVITSPSSSPTKDGVSSSSIRETKHTSLSKKEIRQVNDPPPSYPRHHMLTFSHIKLTASKSCQIQANQRKRCR